MLLDQKLSELSSKGLRNWFEENIAFRFLENAPNFSTFDPALPGGLGFSAAYDPRHKRILFTKKDFKAISRINPGGTFDFSNPTHTYEHAFEHTLSP